MLWHRLTKQEKICFSIIKFQNEPVVKGVLGKSTILIWTSGMCSQKQNDNHKSMQKVVQTNVIGSQYIREYIW